MESVVDAVKKKLAEVNLTLNGKGTHGNMGLYSQLEDSKRALEQAQRLYDFNKEWLDKTVKEKEDLEGWLEANG